MAGYRTLTKYENDLAAGDLFLIRNHLVGKYSEWRYRGVGCSSDDAYKAYVLAFFMSPTSFRYEFESYSDYSGSAVDQQFYLVLGADRRTVLNIFPCETTVLSSTLEAVLQRDAALTGAPISLAAEKKALEEKMEALNRKLRETSTRNETLEEKATRLQKEHDQQIFAEIANNVLTKCAIFLLLPLIVVGIALLVFGSPFGILCIFGGCFLLILIALLLIALKKPLIAIKKRKMDTFE